MLYHKTIKGVDVISSCNTLHLELDHPELEIYAGQWVTNPTEYLIIAEGWQPYTPPYQPTTEVSIEEKMNALLKLHSIGTEVVALDDESALALKAIFPAWIEFVGKEVKADERYFYDNRLWRCVQTHTAQADWTPDSVPALFTEVSVEEFPAWVQPTGAQDAYNQGDKVSHNDQHWISTADGNVWEPGVFGWDVVTE